MKIKAIIIDDEELARQRLNKMLSKYQESIEILGEAKDGDDAIKKITELKPDVIFLDVQMPGKNGFEVVKNLKSSPYIVFVTAFNEYALKAFEENSIDYLLKPVDQSNLERAINKLIKLFPENKLRNAENIEKILNQIIQPKVKRFKVKIGEKLFLIDLEEITYFEAREKYTYLHTSDKEYIIDETIADLEEKLESVQFIRIHRAFIVNIKWIKEITRWFAGKYKVLLKDKKNSELIVSRSYSDKINTL